MSDSPLSQILNITQGAPKERELTKPINSQNNFPDIHEHICETTVKHFWLCIEKYSKFDLLRKT